MGRIKRSTGTRQRIIITVIMMALLLMTAIAIPQDQAQAASVTAKNKKAHNLYNKTINKLAKSSLDCSYKYMDITGDGIHEALASTNTGRDNKIYTYKNGKVKCILTDGQYGLEKITVYKKSKSLITYGAGHGGETYHYFKMKNGKYTKVAEKSREALAGGGMKNGSWYYYNGKGRAIKKSAFNKNISGISKGKKTVLNVLKWKYK